MKRLVELSTVIWRFVGLKIIVILLRLSRVHDLDLGASYGGRNCVGSMQHGLPVNSLYGGIILNEGYQIKEVIKHECIWLKVETLKKPKLKKHSYRKREILIILKSHIIKKIKYIIKVKT